MSGEDVVVVVETPVVEVAGPKANKKTFNAWKKGHRGRPPVFPNRQAKRDAAKVIRELGLTGASEKLEISKPTLAKVAKAMGIKLKRGRKPAAKVA